MAEIFFKQLQLWQSKNPSMKFIYKKIMKRRFCYGTLQVKKIPCSDVFFMKCNSSKMLPVSENKRSLKIFAAWNSSTYI